MAGKDRIEYTDERLTLTDEDGGDIEFHLVARIAWHGKDYAVLEDPEDEDGLMVFRVLPDEEGGERFEMVESETESEDIFYLYEACYSDYEVGEAI